MRNLLIIIFSLLSLISSDISNADPIQVFDLELGPFTLPRIRGRSAGSYDLGDFQLDSLPSDDITDATISGTWSGRFRRGHVHVYVGETQVADIFLTRMGRGLRRMASTHDWSYAFSDAEEAILQEDFLDDGLVDLRIVGTPSRALSRLYLGEMNLMIVDVVPPIPPDNSVPEPATLFLIGSGLIGLAGLKRKFRK